LGGEMLTEARDESLDRPGLGQGFPKTPDGGVVRDRLADAQAQKAREAHPIGDLELHLRIREFVEALQN